MPAVVHGLGLEDLRSLATIYKTIHENLEITRPFLGFRPRPLFPDKSPRR